MRRDPGVTLVEILTVIVVLVVIAAVAVPLWRTRELRAQREVAMKALLAIQAAQDRYFGKHARYADQAQLGTKSTAAGYTLEIRRGDDELSYVATARATRVAGATFDSRCPQMGIDQHSRRFALDESGEDSTADCWERQ